MLQLNSRGITERVPSPSIMSFDAKLDEIRMRSRKAIRKAQRLIRKEDKCIEFDEVRVMEKQLRHVEQGLRFGMKSSLIPECYIPLASEHLGEIPLVKVSVAQLRGWMNLGMNL